MPISAASSNRLWNGLALAALLVALFFLLTNGIPFIQLGILKAFKSKTRYVNTMIISASLCFAFLSALWWVKRPIFQNLWIARSFQKASDPQLGRTLFALFAGYVLILSAVGFMRHAALETRAYDLGIFAQAVWNTLRGDFLYSSLKGGICLLGDHVSPILAVAAPYYALWQDPRALLILQAVAAGSQIFLVAHLVKQKTGNPQLALLFSLIYCFYLPTRNALHEDFHPEVLSEPFLFLAFLFLKERRLPAFWLSAFLAAAGKENMLGLTFMLGVYAFFFEKQRILGSLLVIFSAALFWFEVGWLVPELGHKAHHYQGFYSHLGEGGITLFLQSLFWGEGLEYLFKVFSPVLFLPLFHIPTLVLMLPVLLQNLLSSNPVMRSFAYHYTIGMTPFLFISTVYGFQWLCGRFGWFGRQKIFLAFVLFFVSLLRSGPSEYYYYWQSLSHRSSHRDMIRNKLAAVPPPARVLTHNNFVPQLVNRRYVYQFEYGPEPTKGQTARTVKADYVIFDRGFWEENTAPLGEVLGEMSALGFEIEFGEGDFFILRRNV